MSYTLHHGSFPNVDPTLCCYDIPNDTIPVPECCDSLQYANVLMSTYRTAVTCGVTDDFLPASGRYTFGMIDHTSVLPTVGRNDFTGTSFVSDYHHPSWHVDSIGNVYGIAIDNEGFAYAAASANYGAGFFGYDAIIRYGVKLLFFASFHKTNSLSIILIVKGQM